MAAKAPPRSSTSTRGNSTRGNHGWPAAPWPVSDSTPTSAVPKDAYANYCATSVSERCATHSRRLRMPVGPSSAPSSTDNGCNAADGNVLLYGACWMKVFTTVAARAHTAAPDDVHTHEARASAPAPAGQTRVHIEAFAAADEWQQFVRTADDATFFHSAAWKAVLEEAFGFQTHFLLARRAGAVVGVAPLCELRPLFGKPRLLSLPFAVEAGVSAVDDDVRRGLENAAVDRARTLGARYLELRDGGGGEAFHLRGDTYCRFRHRLSPTDEDNFARIPRKRRRMIRRAQASGLQVRVGADLDIFYRLYAESQRRLGSPLLPRMYFATLLRHFGEDVVVLTVWHAATPVASVFSFIFRDSILPYYAGSRRAPAPCG